MPFRHGYHEGIGNETDKERTDRQLVELLNELRITLPGAQPMRVAAVVLAAPSAT